MLTGLCLIRRCMNWKKEGLEEIIQSKERGIKLGEVHAQRAMLIRRPMNLKKRRRFTSPRKVLPKK